MYPDVGTFVLIRPTQTFYERIKIVGEARVSGVDARVGQQQLGSTSEMLMNQFFDCLRSTFDGG